MDCEHLRPALSARLDGEDPGPLADALERHLAACAACRRFEAEAAALARMVRVAAAEPVPDLTRTILDTLGAERRRGRFDPVALRVGLAAAALAQFLLGAPDLLFPAGGGTVAHLARELGSFDLALAVGFLFAAWRPGRAYGMLPLVAALVACLALTTVVDLAKGSALPFAESAHLLDLFGLGLLWQLARSGPRSDTPRFGTPPRFLPAS